MGTSCISSRKANNNSKVKDTKNQSLPFICTQRLVKLIQNNQNTNQNSHHYFQTQFKDKVFEYFVHKITYGVKIQMNQRVILNRDIFHISIVPVNQNMGLFNNHDQCLKQRQKQEQEIKKLSQIKEQEQRQEQVKLTKIFSQYKKLINKNGYKVISYNGFIYVKDFSQDNFYKASNQMIKSSLSVISIDLQNGSIPVQQPLNLNDKQVQSLFQKILQSNKNNNKDKQSYRFINYGSLKLIMEAIPSRYQTKNNKNKNISTQNINKELIQIFQIELYPEDKQIFFIWANLIQNKQQKKDNNHQNQQKSTCIQLREIVSLKQLRFKYSYLEFSSYMQKQYLNFQYLQNLPILIQLLQQNTNNYLPIYFIFQIIHILIFPMEIKRKRNQQIVLNFNDVKNQELLRFLNQMLKFDKKVWKKIKYFSKIIISLLNKEDPFRKKQQFLNLVLKRLINDIVYRPWIMQQAFYVQFGLSLKRKYTFDIKANQIQKDINQSPSQREKSQLYFDFKIFCSLDGKLVNQLQSLKKRAINNQISEEIFGKNKINSNKLNQIDQSKKINEKHQIYDQNFKPYTLLSLLSSYRNQMKFRQSIIKILPYLLSDVFNLQKNTKSTQTTKFTIQLQKLYYFSNPLISLILLLPQLDKSLTQFKILKFKVASISFFDKNSILADRYFQYIEQQFFIFHFCDPTIVYSFQIVRQSKITNFA